MDARLRPADDAYRGARSTSTYADRRLSATGTAGNLTTDVHLAPLAIGHQCELHSNDNDFAPSPGLRWRNPL